MVQPYWIHLLERIKKGLYRNDPARTNSKVNEDQNADLGSVEDATSSSTDLIFKLDVTVDDTSGSLDEVLSELELEDDISEHSEIAQIQLDFGKHEAVCIECWLSYKWTGIRGLLVDLHNGKVTSLSDDSSESDYSPFHIHS